MQEVTLVWGEQMWPMGQAVHDIVWNMINDGIPSLAHHVAVVAFGWMPFAEAPGPAANERHLTVVRAPDDGSMA